MQKIALGPLKLGLATLVIAGSANATVVLIAGVDFEGSAQNVFDRTPDNYASGNGITVSSGSGTGLFDGWTISITTGGAGASGNLRNDTGTNGAGVTTPDFGARMEGTRIFSWSITIDATTTISLDRIVFDARGATSGTTTTRGLDFRTSLDGSSLWSNPALIGRTATPTNWENVVVDLSGSTYQSLTNTTVSFIWATSGAVDIDSIEVYATFIPEPSTALLGSLGLLPLFRRRRS